jgi:hypothetical protein
LLIAKGRAIKTIKIREKTAMEILIFLFTTERH